MASDAELRDLFGPKKRKHTSDPGPGPRYVCIRQKLTLLKVCLILQEVGEMYGVVQETERGYWVPDWFFMAVWPAAKAGDQEKAEARAYRAVFDEKYQKALATKYALSRSLDADNAQVGMWE